MAKLSIMDHTGHSTVEFGADNTATADAMKKFDELVGVKKYTAATRKTGEHDYRVIKNFADAEDETLLIPAKQGG